MFATGLKNTQLTVTMALLVLCVSICPYSGYPHVEEDEDPTVAKENLDNEEEQQLFLDEYGALEEEQAALEEAIDEENEGTPEICASVDEICMPLLCCTNRLLKCLDVGDKKGKKCIELKPPVYRT